MPGQLLREWSMISLFESPYINQNVLKHNLNNQFVVNLSESTKVKETPIIESGQLLYSVYLNDQTILIRGYIQIWNLDDLENYLVNSERISTFDFLPIHFNRLK